ncbi:MAG TPA: hypothetical protein PLS29_04265 [Acidimicrobiales bacterium]|nr:MAG: hypothetical protein B7Z69_05940 [Actinobacteria bacterium 21-73-9]HQU26228.1 hypothetical protein [Acidimicrobiales bacterium]
MRVEGVVTSFDEARGDGEVTTTRGERLYLHCVSIADGSRRVALGARVVGERRVGRRGADEIGAVETL